MLRNILIFLLVLTNVFMGYAGEINRYWHVTKVSNMQINGATNVSTFQCGSVRYTGADMIHERWDPESAKWEISGSVYIDIAQFDCNNRVMNNDFRNTLQYNDHPYIKIEFMNLKEVWRGKEVRHAAGWVEITLAGKTHAYFLMSELETINRRYSILRGEQLFRFSHFGIDPPQRGFGLVKVEDAVRVHFEFFLEHTDFAESY